MRYLTVEVDGRPQIALAVLGTHTNPVELL
jgi:hypothetical protein